MLILVLSFIFTLAKAAQYDIEQKYQNKNKPLLKIILQIIYLIQYSSVALIAYLITDSLDDFIIVTICFLIIKLLFSALNTDFFNSKLYLRLILVSVIPIIMVLLLIYFRQFTLINSYSTILLAFILPFHAKSKNKDSAYTIRHFLEITVFMISFLIIAFILEHNFEEEVYNKPEICAINQMLDELDISSDDILNVNSRGGLRGETIEVSIITETDLYIVYYKDGTFSDDVDIIKINPSILKNLN